MDRIFFKYVFCAMIFISVLGSANYGLTTESFQTLFSQGQKAHQRGDYKNAIQLLNKAIEADPNSAETYYSLGLVYRDQRAPLSEVVWYFKVAVDINRDYVDAYEELGRLYSAAGKYEPAIEYFQKVLEITPEDLKIHFSLAWIYLNGTSQPTEAIFHFQKVLERTELPNAYYGLGLAYARNKENAKALETITELRNHGYDELAAELEDLIRKEYTPAPQSSPNPPAQQAQPPRQQPPRGVSTSGAPSGTMKVRLRGTLYNTGP